MGRRQKLPSAFPSCKDPGWRAMAVSGRRYSGRWAATSVACLSLGRTVQPRKTMTGIDCKEVCSNQRNGWKSVGWSCLVSPSLGAPQEVGGRVQIGDSGHTCVDMKSHQRSTEHRERCLAARERGWVPGAQGQTDIVWGSSHHAGPERRRAERAGARSHFAIEPFLFFPAAACCPTPPRPQPRARVLANPARNPGRPTKAPALPPGLNGGSWRRLESPNEKM